MAFHQVIRTAGCCIGTSFGNHLLLWNCWSPLTFGTQDLIQWFEVRVGINSKTCSVLLPLAAAGAPLLRDSLPPCPTAGLAAPAADAQEIGWKDSSACCSVRSRLRRWAAAWLGRELGAWKGLKAASSCQSCREGRGRAWDSELQLPLWLQRCYGIGIRPLFCHCFVTLRPSVFRNITLSHVLLGAVHNLFIKCWKCLICNDFGSFILKFQLLVLQNATNVSKPLIC